MKLDTHPTVLKARTKTTERLEPAPKTKMSEKELRALCLSCGADDVTFISVSDPAIADQWPDISKIFPEAKTAISFVKEMNQEPVRTAVRSVVNLEFHVTADGMNETAKKIINRLQKDGRQALNTNTAFPMEVQEYPGKAWVVSHKRIAVESGMGKMGVHRCVIHPTFGSFILLGTLLLAEEIEFERRELDYNPCLECKLCVAACPVEALGPDGSFNFSACYNHNYREFFAGFNDWVETLAESDSAADYNSRVEPHETTSMWQSLAFKPNYKSAYCISACPAGEAVIDPFLADQSAFRERYVKPLQDKAEIVYVLDQSDAQDVVTRKFPNKRIKTVSWTNVPDAGGNALFSMTMYFQRRKAKGLDARFHLTFTDDGATGTVEVKKRTLDVQFGIEGEADVAVTLSCDLWNQLLSRDFSAAAAAADGLIKVEGDIEMLAALVHCFPRQGPVYGIEPQQDA